MNTLLTTIVTLSACYCLWVYAELRDWQPDYSDRYEAVVQAHRYHGIDYAWCTRSGCWFERDGVRCRLFAGVEG